MNKKTIGTVLAFAMTASCTFGLLGCGKEYNSEKDLETVKSAIGMIDSLYGDKELITSSDYEVLGAITVRGENYPINWSIAPAGSCEINDISEFLSIGEMRADNLRTVSVTQAEVDIDYILTATVTVGKASEAVNINHRVPAKVKAHTGTAEDPYLPSNVIEIAKNLEAGAYLQADGKNQKVYVKGYVIDRGTFNSAKNRYNYIYIADSYEVGKGKDSADVIMLYTLTCDTEIVTDGNSIGVGDCLTVFGYIQKYVDKYNKEIIEVTYSGSDVVTAVDIQKAKS